ncbi:MAG: prolipoprotein diacylglyceryl transferase [Planctomycetes bacterium]|nr:prolipoprotein diacylglyceryl transferase [Planctomycetota bacterium]
MGPLEFPAWDPVLIPLPGPVDVRWYGLMYIVGFVAGQRILTRLARAGFLPVAPEKVTDLVFYSVIGTILGGRLGYAIFYQQALFDPLKLLRIWEGGLAFHGGLIGVILALWLFARRNGVPAGRVLDAAALAVTPGILAVRIANFVNGELYGRVTSADTPFAMQFPTDERIAGRMGLGVIKELGGAKRADELMIQYAYGKVDFERVLEHLPRLSPGQVSGREALPPDVEMLRGIRWDDVRQFAPFRHPSQLYEGLGEGLLLGVALWLIYRATRRRPLRPWTYGGMFLLGYGIVRSLLENLRQPDAQFVDAAHPSGTVFLGLTMGQTLSSAMIALGLFLVVRGVFSRRKESAP